MPVTSAAICLWRTAEQAGQPTDDLGSVQILVVHPGGPFWKNKDEGAWSLPKGEYDPAEEDGLTAARREFEEELGSPVEASTFLDLGQTKLKSGKVINAWACEGDIDPDTIVSNTFEIEWPPRSGKRATFPEVDRALWCGPGEARKRLNPAQTVFVDRLLAQLV